MTKVCYWDSETKSQKERDMTPSEEAQRAIDIAAATMPVVPEQVTMRQARLALLGSGILTNVDIAINALPSPSKEAARIEWDYSSTVERHRGLVQSLGAAMGLTEAQLDNLFITAAAL